MNFKELIQECDFYELVSQTTKLTKTKENEYKGLSPFTSEKTPSFFINSEAKTWYCFSSGKGGGLIDYVMEYEGLSKPEAIKFLESFCNVTLDSESKNNIFVEAQKNFVRNVSSGYEYLEKRNITPKIAEKYGLGFCKGNDVLHDLKNFSKEEISESGLVNEKGNIKFYNRVTLPIKDQYGNIVSFTGRAIDSSLPKYLHGSSTKYFNKKEIVWNLDIARRDIIDQDMVIVCEGQLDAIAVNELGYPAVSLLGTNFSKQQLKLLSNLTKNIYFIFDSDSAGREALKKSFDLIGELGVDVISYAITLPGSHDPASFIQEYGEKQFSHFIESAQPDTSAIISYFIEKYKNRGSNQRKLTKTGLTQKIIEDLRPYVEEQFTYRSLDLIERLSQELGLNKKGLHDWFSKKERVEKSFGVFEKINDLQFPAPVYERRIFYHLLKNPSLWYILQEEGITRNDFSSYLIGKSLQFIHQEQSTAEFIEEIKNNLSEEEHNTIMSFFAVGLEGDFETSLEVFKIKIKENKVSYSSSATDFLGRPKTKEEKEMTEPMIDRVFREKEPF